MSVKTAIATRSLLRVGHVWVAWVALKSEGRNLKSEIRNLKSETQCRAPLEIRPSFGLRPSDLTLLIPEGWADNSPTFKTLGARV